MIDFVALGEQQLPGLPTLRCVPAVPRGDAAGLYQARQKAVADSNCEWVCFVDGNEDILVPEFTSAMGALAFQADVAGVPIGYAAETIYGQPGRTGPFEFQAFIQDHQLIHHGVVCRRQALLDIDWPHGRYAWEVIAYGVLAQQGFIYDPVPRYDWRPGPQGARTWPAYQFGLINSKRWLQGLPCRK